MSHFIDRLKYFTNPKEAFSGNHGLVTGEDRTWEDAYRNRWAHDKIVRLRDIEPVWLREGLRFWLRSALTYEMQAWSSVAGAGSTTTSGSTTWPTAPSSAA